MNSPILRALAATARELMEFAPVLVIDEIQRHPQLTWAIKAAADRDRGPGRFILTGSSDVARVRGGKDSLAG